MEIQDIKIDKKELRSIHIRLRTFPSYSKWMKDNEVSPSKLFNKAVEELMKKSPKKKK